MAIINLINNIKESASLLNILNLISIVVIVTCTFIIFLSILINFIESNKSRTKDFKNSIVNTTTMFLFFIFFYILLRFNIGIILIPDIFIRSFLNISGLILIILGCITNVLGRLQLGKNWADQIRIYENQSFIQKGIFGLVRHPLYASLIWMFYGGCLIYQNYFGFLINTFIFVPFMYYRAKEEEKLLIKEFKSYKDYMINVGMFFPKLIWFQKRT